MKTVQCHVLIFFFFFSVRRALASIKSFLHRWHFIYILLYMAVVQSAVCVRACVCLPCRRFSIVVGVVVLICCQQHPIWTPNLTHGPGQKPIFLVNLWRQGRPSVVISAERKSFSYHRRGARARACSLACYCLLPFIKALKSYLVVVVEIEKERDDDAQSTQNWIARPSQLMLFIYWAMHASTATSGHHHYIVS